MTETQTIWLVLALIYAAECVRWLRPGQSLARSWRGLRWRISGLNPMVSNHRGGPVLYPPFPPLGTVFVCGDPPLQLAPEGFASADAAQISLPWAGSSEVDFENRIVRVAGRVFCHTASPGLARHVARVIHQLAQLDSASRVGAIARHFAAALDTDAVRRRLDELNEASRGLRWRVNALFIFVFVLAPVVAWLVDFSRCWWVLLLGAFALAVPVAWRFRRAHRRLFPDAGEELFSQFLLVLLSPVSAIRARDLLTRPLLETFHPLAVTRVLAEDTAFRARAERTLRDLRHGPEPADSIGASSRVALLSAVEDFLRREKIEPLDLLRAPVPAEAGCVAYCPRCLAQFTTLADGCPDCGAPRLEPLAKVP